MTSKKKLSAELPADVQIPFIQSLYDKRGVIVFGMVTQIVFSCAVAYDTGVGLFYWFAVAFAAVYGARLFEMHRFDKIASNLTSLAYAKVWESRYLAGGVVVSLLTGMFCFFAIGTGDEFAIVVSVTLAFGAMVSVVGRNFASRMLVTLLAACTLFPVLAALLIKGDAVHLVVGSMLVPFFFSITSMADGLRDFLLQAVMGKHQVASIAGRLDAAMNNMPQGLMMIDHDNRIVVANHRAALMLGGANEGKFIGRDLRTVLRFMNRGNLFGVLSVDQVESRLLALLQSNEDRRFTLHLKDGRYLEFGARKRGELGGVLIFEDISERIANEEKIHRMARFDALSGLPNRAYFRDLARSAAMRCPPETYVAFVVVDIDDFKSVNDSLGHPTGDDLLCRFADRIAAHAGESVAFSRFGGDEFVGILTGAANPDEAIRRADAIIASLQGSYVAGGQNLITTTSAGVVVAPVVDLDIDALLIKADLALYESKHRGKGLSTLFAEDMDERYQRRQKLKKDLKAAITDKKLTVVYQPIIDAHTMQIVSCEALARWDHPELGPISPGIFIPLAEETGVISDLTRFMLMSACRDCLSWGNDVGVSVNLSAVDFRLSDVSAVVREALDFSTLAARRLEVEVTESAILDDQTATSTVLADLRKLGVKVALDDFGTGYSSLSYLNNLPLDKVKIDQSFIRQIDGHGRSLKLVTGVTQLAKELGLIVTVEGVETVDQFELLKENAHIDLVQGFLFGAALSPKGISTLINNVFSLSSSKQSKIAVRAGGHVLSR